MSGNKPHCFTIRRPTELYIQLCDLAEASNVTMNTKVIELLNVGITRTVDMREVIERMLDKEFGNRDSLEPNN